MPTQRFKIAVVLHVFYGMCLDEIILYLKNIPYEYDLYISTTYELKMIVRQKVQKAFPKKFILIEVVENRGYDLGPFVATFSNIYSEYDLICKIHEKISLHDPRFFTWRRYLLDNLLGSEKIIKTICGYFANDRKLGIVFPEFYRENENDIKRDPWVKNFERCKEIADKLAISIFRECNIVFPAGSMFWCRPAALKSILSLKLKLEDFENSNKQVIDGTLSHAIERLFVYAAGKDGFKYKRILFKKLPPADNQQPNNNLLKQLMMADFGVFCRTILKNHMCDKLFRKCLKEFRIYGFTHTVKKCINLINKKKYISHIYLEDDMCEKNSESAISLMFGKTINHYFTEELSEVSKFTPQLLKEILQYYSNAKHGLSDLCKALQDISPKKGLSAQSDSRNAPPVETDRKLKILYICGMFPSANHGGGLRISDIITELTKKHEVDLFSVYDQKLDGQYFQQIKSIVKNIKIVNRDLLSTKELCKWLKLIKKEDYYYDIIQMEYPHTISMVDELHRYGKKVGFTFMECISRRAAIDVCNNIKAGKSSLKSMVDFITYAKMENYISHKADFTIAVTTKDSDYVTKFGGIVSYIVPTCIPISLSEAIIPESLSYEYSAAFVGFFDHYPNIEAMEWYLKNIHSLVKNMISGYKIVIIGYGDTSLLKKNIQDDSSVIFTGFVNNLAEYIKKTKICISPLISGAGIRAKINQYSILGKPTVSTSIGLCGTPYIHGESVLKADSPREFADSIIELLNNNELYEKIKKGCKKVALDNFTWEKQIKKLESIYLQ